MRELSSFLGPGSKAKKTFLKTKCRAEKKVGNVKNILLMIHAYNRKRETNCKGCLVKEMLSKPISKGTYIMLD